MTLQLDPSAPLNSFRLHAPPMLLTSSLYNSTLQLSEIWGGPNHGLTTPQPPREIYLVQMRLIDCFGCDIFVDGRHVSQNRCGRAGMLDVQDQLVGPRAELRDPFRLMFLHVSRAALAQCAYEMGYHTTGELRIDTGNSVDDPVARHLFLGIRPALTSPLGRNRLFIDYALSALTTHLVYRHTSIVDRRATTAPTLADWQARRLRELINESLSDTLTLAALAQAVGLSVRQLSRAFHGSFGMPPHRYLMQCRVLRARELLLAPRLTLLDVALASGFASQSHFGRVFKTVTGLTPGAWRRAHDISTRGN